MYKIEVAHLNCVKNQYAKFEYKGMKTVEVTDYTNQTPPKNIMEKSLLSSRSPKMKKKLELSEKLTIAPLQCLACSKRPECLRILSGNIILISMEGHNSLKICEKLELTIPT